MGECRFLFASYSLDPANRQLEREGEPIELGGRYFDALVLLVGNAGDLVTKDHFMDEVWRGVPVTDEALTQAIRTIRKCLNDDASAPRFVETVPRYGYRFIAPVERASGEAGRSVTDPKVDHRNSNALKDHLLLAGAGTLGGGLAGFVGGAIYGAIVASAAATNGGGAASAFLVVMCLTILVSLLGAAGVCLGMAVGQLAGRGWALVLGAAAGGLVIGALGRLLGLDAFTLILGQSPGNMTGAFEGAVLGGGVGGGVWLALSLRGHALAYRMVAAGLVAATSGLLVAVTGGRLMAGSLDLLARQFPQSRIDLSALGTAFGGDGFGMQGSLASAGMEGFLFGTFIAGAIIVSRRNLQIEDVPRPVTQAP
ncbi:transcriptional regulator [Altererythrobacter aurantiacus]|uniref:Transcriptional regulator n=1 Tax=Parapontixanthobacter aurantiacus TaxID=1463599 RepID=A0A844ZFF2_9SPHN|nr:transcriptional regulator [Parapontixanthobacter aurantiacus]MXO85972.1 transcriptional regulator [Parapontixanthobacter aurantiacus]